MKKMLLILLSLLIFVPCLSAEEIDYSNYEVIDVSELPEASSDTLNKVYLVNDKYYFTNKIDSEYSPLNVGDNVRGKTIYINSSDPQFIINTLNNSSGCGTDKTVLSYSNSSTSNSSLIRFNIFSSNFSLHIGSVYNVLYYDISKGLYTTYVDSYVVPDDKDYIIIEPKNTCQLSLVDLQNIFSYTPFEISYEWIEINYYENKDMYLFFDYETISDFDIFEDIDFTTFTDFEKLNITLLVNIFFGLFLFLCIYIIIRLLYKMLSGLFG